MVFWRRISQSKLKQVSDHIERCYLQASRGSSRHYTAPVTSIGAEGSPLTGIRRRDSLGFYSNVRFFAAPVQAKRKEEEKDRSARRLNEQIKAREVRVVTDEGHFIVPFEQALQEAKRLSLDLVEVQRNANPPVVKIFDYHMKKYKSQQAAKERAKAKGKLTVRGGILKDVRFSVKAEAKDLAVKADSVKRLMDRGYRVKCMAVGTEDQDLGGLLARMVALIEDVSLVESGPQVERNQAFVIVRHIKFGPRKGGGKKKVDVGAEIKQQQAALALAMEQSGNSNSPIPEKEDLYESAAEETEEEISFNEDVRPIKFQFDPSTKVFDLQLTSNRRPTSDFQGPAQVQADRAPPQEVPQNRYARKTEQGRRFPPHNPVDNNNPGRGSRDSFGFNPPERMRMPSDPPRQDRAYPNFSRNSRVPHGEMQKPGPPRRDGPGPQDGSPSFGIFSNQGGNAPNNQR